VGQNDVAANAERPDLVPGRSANPTGKRVAGGFTYGFDPTAFTLQPAGVFGNLSCNTLTAFGVRELDMSVSKNTHLTEGKTLQLRAEAFNITNHMNLGFPSANLYGAANSGEITSTATLPRQIQFSAKFSF
jgi:hypothetical protein